jgi:hypothetical protein
MSPAWEASEATPPFDVGEVPAFDTLSEAGDARTPRHDHGSVASTSWGGE